MIAALLAGAACVLVSASYRLYDTDVWQLLAVGREIWSSGIPRADLWTWTHYGEPTFVSSWAFRALIWPLWSWAGVPGLFALRWVVALATFALLLATARMLGARGLSAVVVLVGASLLYRLRTDVRPETLASLLLALALWLLARDRSRGGTRAVWWMVAVACVWANLHISYYLGLLLLGLHLLDALLAARAGPPGHAAATRARRLALVAVAAVAASFVNPYGGEALAQPFRFAFDWRSDPMFAAIDELRPLSWREVLTQGLWIWPALALWRAFRRGPDRVEAAACVAFTALAIGANRFVATWALVAAPFVARDLHDLLASRRWPVPRWPAGARAALAAAACVALCAPAWARANLPLGVGMDPRSIPERACDFMAERDVRGRGFNHFHLGGYLAYRFAGERDRLPFMSTQPELASAEERALYVAALRRPADWYALDRRYRFDWALLDHEQLGGDVLLDVLDRDTTWALVFADDAAVLLVRRGGASAAVAEAFAYRLMPAGRDGRLALGVACERDPRLRALAVAELERMIAASPLNGGASHLRGMLALMDGDLAAARAHLERAIALDPLRPEIHELLAEVALEQGRPRDALRELERERRRHAAPPGSFHRSGMAWQRLGEPGRAREWYRRELARDPGHVAARESLAALDARGL
jgi:tetratricopeptide (TPR) repeat protein